MCKTIFSALLFLLNPLISSQVQNLVTYYGHVNSGWTVCVHIWYIGVCCFVSEIWTPLLCCHGNCYIGFPIRTLFTNILNLFYFHCCTIILQLPWLHILDGGLILGIPNSDNHGNAVWPTDTKGLCVCGIQLCVTIWNINNIFHVANTNCNNSSKLAQHLLGKGHDIGPIHDITAIITCHKEMEWYESSRKILNIFIIQSCTTQSHFS